MSAYYNEFDPFAAAWLRELIKLGLIAPGDVDERSIKDVTPDDLRGYTQCHFFAGIGGWSHAARLAGWADSRPLWTGSCPCQPFSAAGKGGGVDDPRHLWPDFFRLIRACRPPVVMGEQVAGKAGYGWFDGVRADLAREDYACRGVDVPACAVDAPHIRQRLWWVAVGEPQRGGLDGSGVHARPGAGLPLPARADGSPEAGRGGRLAHPDQGGPGGRPGQPAGDIANGHPAGRQEGPGRTAGGDEGDLADADGALGRFGDQQRAGQQPLDEQNAGTGVRAGPRDGVALGDAYRQGLEVGPCERGDPGSQRPTTERADVRPTFWSGADWLACHDGKARRTEPGLPLLAHGVPGRVAKWRGFGNAIVPQVAAEVIGAFMDYEQDRADQELFA